MTTNSKRQGSGAFWYLLLMAAMLFIGSTCFSQTDTTVTYQQGDGYYGDPYASEMVDTKLKLIFSPPCAAQYWVYEYDTTRVNESALNRNDTLYYHWHLVDSTAKERKGKYKVIMYDDRPYRIDIMAKYCITYVILYVKPNKGWEEDIHFKIEEGVHTHFMYLSPSQVGLKPEDYEQITD